MNVSARNPDESSLFGEMRHQIHITQMPAPRRRPRFPAVRFAGHPRILAGGATAAVAAGTAAVLAIGAATTAPPAFAVANNQDGSVTITLYDLTGVSGLNAKLASMGVAIRAVPVVSGCHAPAQVVGPASERPQDGELVHLAGDHGRSSPTPGQTEIVAASTSGIDLLGQTVQGQVPSCVAPAGPTPPAAGTPLVGGGESTIQLGSQ